MLGRIVLLGLAVWLLYVLVRRQWPGRRSAAPPDEPMVCCAACGLHLPQSESVLSRGRRYCCEAHADRDGS